MDLKGRKILVTGASGFIGSHLVEALLHRGAHVRAFVRYTSHGDLGMLRDFPERLRDQIDWIFGDLRDPAAVREAVTGTDIVFHLGAVISVPYSYDHPREVVEVNVLGTLNVLEASRTLAPMPRVIHVSSSEVYGTAVYTPMDERHPRHAQSPYAASKTGADELARSFYATYGLPVTIVRPFNTFGPRQSPRAVIMSIVIQALTQGGVKIGNLHPVRDFTFVTDTVEGLIASAETEETVGEEFNLGTGKGISIRDLIAKIEALLGTSLEIQQEDERIRPETSEVQALIADPSKARQLIQWQPKVSLDQGLERTIRWVQEKLKDPAWRFWFESRHPRWR